MTPMQMLQIAVSQGADLERIQKLMDLQDRWEAKAGAPCLQRGAGSVQERTRRSSSRI
jgi:hypothetical protein